MYPVKYFLNTDYEEMEILGIKGLFTNLRVEKESLPQGFYKYSLREGEEDFFSSVENSVLVNHSGDFICKVPLDLGEAGEKDLGEDYNFTGNKVDLNEFFGEDILDKVAYALDRFMADLDPYEYADNLTPGSKNMVYEIRDMFRDKEQAEGIVQELDEICREVEFVDPSLKALAEALKGKCEDIVRGFPERKPSLRKTILAAENLKEASTVEKDGLEPPVAAQ